ncbi:MAG: alpha/beta hydrolase [Gemmatimonadaceae bacterium]|nr:alpha/beta hydrolase [Gemmatimonadaceae bacterium]
MRRLLLLFVAALAAGTFWLNAKDPEHRTLADDARQSAGGAFVHLPDGITHYDVSGPDSGARVVLVHGFSVPAYIWDSTFTALTAAGYRVARYDTYGRGWSDRPETTYDFSLFDRQLTGLLDSLGWKEPVHVMGLSYGGPVTSTFVGRHPERVATHVLVDPAAGSLRQVPWYMAAPLIGPFLWQTLAVPGMADGQASDFVHPEGWPDWADKYRVQMQFKGFGRALRATILANRTVNLDSLYATTGKAGKPTLLIWGTEDKTVPIANAEQVRKGIPQAEWHPISNAGHLPHMEQARVVDSLLLDFLTRNNPRPTTKNP